MSGAGCDLRDIEAAAASGDADAELAIDVFIAAIRHYLGAYLLELDGADAIVFTGGIGENSSRDSSGGLPRAATGSASSSTRLGTPAGPPERMVSTAGSRVQIWTVPTNEEIVVARQVKQLLERTRRKTG